MSHCDRTGLAAALYGFYSMYYQVCTLYFCEFCVVPMLHVHMTVHKFAHSEVVESFRTNRPTAVQYTQYSTSFRYTVHRRVTPCTSVTEGETGN